MPSRRHFLQGGAPCSQCALAAVHGLRRLATANPLDLVDNLKAGQGRLPDAAMRRRIVQACCRVRRPPASTREQVAAPS
ncbi:hypothetical protein SAMN05216588_11086 [Pseudomonas flavescens]|uniref:Uncharacterized protein n=1 Tax=Phytopseudomonas flavescens TaxID=29435 RepID=A0A1G8H7B4_9GAMM|nr:hypothetical protein [Pseudomonas flavescens]SDI02439.1 hypothetical protein SAMN05216588_11086 [Pseudomonas flavescens]